MPRSPEFWNDRDRHIRLRQKRARKADRLAGLLIAAWVLVVLAFWAAVIFVAVHFITKVW